MRGKKISVIIIGLALLVGYIVALRLRRNKPVGPSVSEASRLIGGPGFEVQVEMPAFNSGRAPWEIPGVILGYDHGPRFDQASPGAKVGKIAPDHIELSAGDGWDLLIETDREGRLAQGTHVGFPVKLGGRSLTFNCRPADPTVGYLHTSARTGSDELERQFPTGSRYLQECCLRKNCCVALPTAQGSWELCRVEKARMKDEGAVKQ